MLTCLLITGADSREPKLHSQAVSSSMMLLNVRLRQPEDVIGYGILGLSLLTLLIVKNVQVDPNGILYNNSPLWAIPNAVVAH